VVIYVTVRILRLHFHFTVWLLPHTTHTCVRAHYPRFISFFPGSFGCAPAAPPTFAVPLVCVVTRLRLPRSRFIFICYLLGLVRLRTSVHARIVCGFAFGSFMVYTAPPHCATHARTHTAAPVYSFTRVHTFTRSSFAARSSFACRGLRSRHKRFGLVSPFAACLVVQFAHCCARTPAHTLHALSLRTHLTPPHAPPRTHNSHAHRTRTFAWFITLPALPRFRGWFVYKFFSFMGSFVHARVFTLLFRSFTFGLDFFSFSSRIARLPLYARLRGCCARLQWFAVRTTRFTGSVRLRLRLSVAFSFVYRGSTHTVTRSSRGLRCLVLRLVHTLHGLPGCHCTFRVCMQHHMFTLPFTVYYVLPSRTLPVYSASLIGSLRSRFTRYCCTPLDLYAYGYTLPHYTLRYAHSHSFTRVWFTTHAVRILHSGLVYVWFAPRSFTVLPFCPGSSFVHRLRFVPVSFRFVLRSLLSPRVSAFGSRIYLLVYTHHYRFISLHTPFVLFVRFPGYTHFTRYTVRSFGS